MSETLLIELLTEELPPKSLPRLSEAFAESIAAGLKHRGFLAEHSTVTRYATPRRLAVSISHVLDTTPDKPVREKLLPVSVGLTARGDITPALDKKLAAFSLSGPSALKHLTRVTEGKTEFLFYEYIAPGAPLSSWLGKILADTISELPISKLMSYQDNEGNTFDFARPAHRLIALHGRNLVPIKALGLSAGQSTIGHRFMSSGEIAIAHASEYEATLETKGAVIPSFERRRGLIERQLRAAAKNSELALNEALLVEVTALTEFPVVYAGVFAEEFLAAPQECLMLAMQQHQRYIPTLRDGKLLPRFLMVANIEAANPGNIITGNERVLRARLADAKFFFDQDRKVRLENRVPRLANVVYHRKLGTQLERVGRIEALTENIARMIGADSEATKRAAHLCKADLTTGMVGEFPELQGIMGGYYSRHDGEPEEVAHAIATHYRPRFSGDDLPQGAVAISVALADKLEALAGLFGIGQQPTGDKDPFALRRHALGVVRILVERELQLPLAEFVNTAFAVFPSGMLGDAHTDLELFIFERLRGYLRDQGYTANEVEAVLCRGVVRLDLIPRQLAAVRAFADLPEAESLAAANKRVANILKQAEGRGESFANSEAPMLKEPAERALFDALRKTSKHAASLFEQGDFTGYLKSFAVLKSPVDAFFDSVMVMVEDSRLRRNRLALLADLRREMNRVADISKLAA